LEDLLEIVGTEVMAEDVRAASSHFEGHRERIPDYFYLEFSKNILID